MNIHNLQTGDKLTGLYCGVFFSGDVVRIRPCHMSHKRLVISVLLDRDITVFGERRDMLLIQPDEQGIGYAADATIWSIQQGRNFHMADRFEKIETSPAYAVKLYREMLAQSDDRSKAMDNLKITTMDWHMREIEIRDACQVLINHYTEIMTSETAIPSIVTDCLAEYRIQFNSYPRQDNRADILANLRYSSEGYQEAITWLENNPQMWDRVVALNS